MNKNVGRRNQVKERDLEKEEIDSGRALVWDSRLLVMPLKVIYFPCFLNFDPLIGLLWIAPFG